MKIRTRLVLWYGAILMVLLAVIGVGIYQEWKEQGEHRQHIDWSDALDESGEMVVWIGVPAVGLGLAGGWWMTRKAIAPLTALTQSVQKIHERNLRQPLPRSRNGDELDQLTEVFNAMTTRLDDAFQRIREFTLHASHELKTPLTVMRGELETALRENALPVAQKERMLSQIDEIERLAKIVDGLTLLTKADAGQIPLKFEPLRLDELVRENAADAKILAQPTGVDVELLQCDETTISGDRHRLRQLLLNLADNAVKYNIPAGSVKISLRRNGRGAQLEMANTGPGLGAEQQAHVFDRFFRGDASHNNATDGCGLGLSIAQWITAAHGGTIQFDSKQNEMTTVTVNLPAGPAA